MRRIIFTLKNIFEKIRQPPRKRGEKYIPIPTDQMMERYCVYMEEIIAIKRKMLKFDSFRKTRKTGKTFGRQGTIVDATIEEKREAGRIVDGGLYNFLKDDDYILPMSVWNFTPEGKIKSWKTIKTNGLFEFPKEIGESGFEDTREINIYDISTFDLDFWISLYPTFEYSYEDITLRFLNTLIALLTEIVIVSKRLTPNGIDQTSEKEMKKFNEKKWELLDTWVEDIGENDDFKFINDVIKHEVKEENISDQVYDSLSLILFGEPLYFTGKFDCSITPKTIKYTPTKEGILEKMIEMIKYNESHNSKRYNNIIRMLFHIFMNDCYHTNLALDTFRRKNKEIFTMPTTACTMFGIFNHVCHAVIISQEDGIKSGHHGSLQICLDNLSALMKTMKKYNIHRDYEEIKQKYIEEIIENDRDVMKDIEMHQASLINSCVVRILHWFTTTSAFTKTNIKILSKFTIEKMNVLLREVIENIEMEIFIGYNEITDEIKNLMNFLKIQENIEYDGMSWYNQTYMPTIAFEIWKDDENMIDEIEYRLFHGNRFFNPCVVEEFNKMFKL